MLMVGLIALGVGVACAVGYVLTQRRLGHVLAARQSTIGEVAAMARTVGDEVGADAFSEYVTLAGEVRCPAPLQSPLGGRECLHYQLSVRREYEETYEERDDKGNVRQRTRRGSETLSEEERSTPFALDDGSGQVTVQPEGADLDPLQESVDRFEPGEGPASGRLQIGGLDIRIGGLGRGRRTLGYRYQEHVFAPGGRVTAIGQVTSGRDGLTLATGGPVLLISGRSRQEIVRGTQRRAKVLLAVSGLGVLAGAISLLVHWLS